MADQVEAGQNQIELKQLTKKAAQAVTMPPEQRQQEPKTREEQSRY